MLELKEKKIGIFGIQGSGKTECAKFIIKEKFKKPFVITPNHSDFQAEKCYLYKARNIYTEIDYVCGKVKELALAGKIDVLVIDEADLIFKSNYDLKKNLNDLVINHRHYKLALIFVSRRPQDIPTKIVESCHVLIVYSLEGDNALRKFDNISRGMSWEISRLTYKRYNFIIKEIGEKPYFHEPLPFKDEKTNSKTKESKKKVHNLDSTKTNFENSAHTL